MDRRVMRERMRRKQRQIRRRKIIKLVTYVVALVLAVIFVIKGVLFPIINRIGGRGTGQSQQVQAEEEAADPTAAVRQPLKGAVDATKVTSLTVGWQEDANGKWYQNADGTYYAGGFAEIDGVKYSFDANGYMQTGWVTKGVNDYYFNEDGSYDASKKRPLIALTFDDGPGQYTDELLDCLEENNAHATFFMLGQNVENYQDTVKRMLEIGCELGNHSWDHLNMFNLSIDDVVANFGKADQALIDACGQESTVARAPYGNCNDEIISAVGKPFFMWSIDSRDWDLMDADLDYNAVMNDEGLQDGAVILMHDIHEPSVQAALRLIPDLIAQGYKLVTVSEMAAAKNVTLQPAKYAEFWQSALDAGYVAGYNGNGSSDDASTDSSDSSTGDGSEDSSDGGDSDFSDGGSSDESEGYTDGSDSSDGDFSDSGE